MQTSIKICGITRLQDAEAAVELGAEYLGLIFVRQSKRCIDIDTAREISNSLKDRVKIIGVFQNSMKHEMDEIASVIGLDYFQLHGNETVSLCASLPKPVIKAFQIVNTMLSDESCININFDSFREQSLAVLDKYRSVCEHFLFDRPKNNNQSGSLEIMLNQLVSVEEQLKNYFIAGNIGANNLAIVLESLTPMAIDISSAVEMSPGYKSEILLRELFNQFTKHNEDKVQARFR